MFSRRVAVLTCLVAVLVINFAVRLFPPLRLFVWTFSLGVVGGFVLLLAVLLVPSRRPSGRRRVQLNRWRLGASVLRSFNLSHSILRQEDTIERTAINPPNPTISELLDVFIALIVRDFVSSWASNITSNQAFALQVELALRNAVGKVISKCRELDLVDLVVEHIIPILTAHLASFTVAEKRIQDQSLNKKLTDSEGADFLIARKYRNGLLHPAASLNYSDTSIPLVQKDYLRSLVQRIIPQILPEAMCNSRLATSLITEIVSSGVLHPVMNILSDPDTFNQLVEAMGRSMLQDRNNVRKLREALEQHTNTASVKSERHRKASLFFRIKPGDDERLFEKFVRAIRSCNNLSEARRMRSEISSQLRKDQRDPSSDPTYLKRLEAGKHLLDQQVSLLASNTVDLKRNISLPDNGGRLNLKKKIGGLREIRDVTEILRDSAGLSYFMEYMDRQHRLPLVQFWLVVDGMRNPLEDDEAAIVKWSSSDRNDLAQIYDVYLNASELKIAERTKADVREFLDAGSKASTVGYKRARAAVLKAQTEVQEEMQTRDLVGFKESDLFYKFLGLDDPAKLMNGIENMESVDNDSDPYEHMSRSASWADSKPNAHPPNLHKRHSFDETKSILEYDPLGETDPLFEPAGEFDANEFVDSGVVEAMEAALNNIIDDGKNAEFYNKTENGMLSSKTPMASSASLDFSFAPRNAIVVDGRLTSQPIASASLENQKRPVPSIRDNRGVKEKEPVFHAKASHSSSDFAIKHEDSDATADFPGTATNSKKSLPLPPSISSLGLITDVKGGVFSDELFPDEAAEKFHGLDEDDSEFPTDDHEEEIHLAGPGDLGLAEAISNLSLEIEKLGTQEAVVDSLMKKAELTNNAVELRILRKSKASLEREMRRKELQRQQYIVQESDNTLYGRASVNIRSFAIENENGREFVLYIIEMSRQMIGSNSPVQWNIARRYSEFFQLNQDLRAKFPSVAAIDFPRRRMVIKLHKDFIEKRRQSLERYLQQLLRIPEVCTSREFRAFLSQSSIVSPPLEKPPTRSDAQDLMRRLYSSLSDSVEDVIGTFPSLENVSASQRPTSLLGNALPNSQEVADNLAETQAELIAFEDPKLRQPFVKPICDLFLEVFSLAPSSTSTSAWLRGRAVVVVLHQLLGGAIERKIREQGRLLLNDESVIRILNHGLETFWPDGKKRVSGKERSAKDKEKSRSEARKVLQSLLPDLVGQVVGRSNAKEAARKVCAAFNVSRLK